MKKSICVVLVIVLASLFTIGSVSAKNVSDTPSVEAFSEEFPNAYIESTYVPASAQSLTSNDDGSEIVGYVEATVYVENTYQNVNGEVVQTGSRLLSEEEVLEIGKENFGSGSAQNYPAPLAEWEEQKPKGKLTFRCFVMKYNTGTNRYQLFGGGVWENSGSLFNKDLPAEGDDYIGLTWGGDYSLDVYNADATWNIGTRFTPTLSDAVPNSTLVWRFSEYNPPAGGFPSSYVNNVSCWANLRKNTLTGNGNTTSFLAKYIHTYEATQGSVSISGSLTGGGSAGFTLSNVSQQWSLVCMVNNIPY